jgi:putative flippase GtrA
MRPRWVERWLRFNGAGLLGVVVQIGTLSALVHTGMGYLLATALAVECAVLHNFLWHERWTWRDRALAEPHRWLPRLLRFHLANGLISMFGNLVLMSWLVGILGGPVLLSNILTIVLCGTANFVAGDLFVFRAPHAGDAS